MLIFNGCCEYWIAFYNFSFILLMISRGFLSKACTACLRCVHLSLDYLLNFNWLFVCVCMYVCVWVCVTKIYIQYHISVVVKTHKLPCKVWSCFLKPKLCNFFIDFKPFHFFWWIGPFTWRFTSVWPWWEQDTTQGQKLQQNSPDKFSNSDTGYNFFQSFLNQLL